MIKNILFDLDNTILDFSKSERKAIENTINHFGIHFVPKMADLFSKINLQQWELLEKGIITRTQVKEGRFKKLFLVLGSEVDPKIANDYYEQSLCSYAYTLDGAKVLLSTLSDKYRLYAVSNGTRRVQHSRIKLSGVENYFEKIYLSQEIGFEKPSANFFKPCFDDIPNFSTKETMIVGDSLTSDIQGGINTGIITVWLNYNNLENKSNIIPDFTISKLTNLFDVLDKLNN